MQSGDRVGVGDGVGRVAAGGRDERVRRAGEGVVAAELGELPLEALIAPLAG